MNKELRRRLKKVLDDTEDQLDQIAEVVAALIAQRAAHSYLCTRCEGRFTEAAAGAAKGECPAGCDAYLVRDDLKLSADGPRIIDDPEGAQDRWLRATGKREDEDEDADGVPDKDDPEVDPGVDDPDTFTPAEAERRRISLPGTGPRVVDDEDDEVQPGVASKRPAQKPAHANDVQRSVRKSGGRLDGTRLDRLPRPTRKSSSDAFPKARRGGSRFI